MNLGTMLSCLKVSILLIVAGCALGVYSYSFFKIDSVNLPIIAVSDEYNLTAYYQCKQHIRAAREVLKNFRKLYPKAELVMVNDGGDVRLQSLAEEFGARYEYSNKTSNRDNGMYFSSSDKAAVYFSRILNASSHCDWLLLLEDDVWVLNMLPLHSLKHPLNGGYKGMVLNHAFAQVINHSQFQYAGNGGSLLKCQFFRDIEANGGWRKNLDDILHAKGEEVASDELLSVLTYMHGGSVGTYPGYSEPGFFWFLYDWFTNKITVLHQAKYLYE
jgi:hypothetical protein